MKALVIYHANCTDGFTAAWVFHHFQNTYPEAGMFDFHAGNYGSPVPPLDGYDRVFLVDFSYPRATIEEMLSQGKAVHILDHHITAIQDLEGLEHPRYFPVLDTSRSGARIAWDWLFTTKEPPKLLDYVQDRDLWQFKLPLSKETSAYMSSVAKRFDTWDELMVGGDDIIKHARWASHGEAILRATKRHCEEIARGAQILEGFLGQYDVPVCNCPGAYASDVGHILAQNHPFSVTFNLSGGKMYVSLRSRADGGEDVSKIAKHFGGGGHRNSAGFVATGLTANAVFCAALSVAWNQKPAEGQ